MCRRREMGEMEGKVWGMMRVERARVGCIISSALLCGVLCSVCGGREVCVVLGECMWG